MNDENHKTYIKKYYDEYKKIGKVGCPAFNNEEIYLNKKGFRHLIYKNNNRRSDVEYKVRLNLIQHIPVIIKTSNRYSEVRKLVSGNKVICFWSLVKRIGNRDIILIIRKINDKPKHFFSIMYKK